MNSTVRVTAYECKTKQAEIFRRAAAGETIIVTNNGRPQVEIRKVSPENDRIAAAVRTLGDLQREQLAAGVGGGADELRRTQEQGRD